MMIGYKFKVFLILSFFFALNINVLAQNDTIERNFDLMYDVTIRSSAGPYYLVKTQLQKEGLLISRLINKSKGRNRLKTKFIPIEQLVKRLDKGIEIVDFFNYIHNMGIMKINEIEEPDLSHLGHRNWIAIQFFDIKKGTCSYLEYGYFDERIDQLIDYMNAILPRKYREEYSIKKNWLPGTRKKE